MVKNPALAGTPAAERRRRRRIYLIATALFAAVLVAYTYTSWHHAESRRDRHLEALAVLGSQGIDTYFTTLQKSLGELADDLNRQGIDERTGALLRDYQAHFPEFGVVILRSLDGATIASSAPQLPDVRNQPTLLEARRRLDAGVAMVVNRAFYGAVSKAWVTPLTYAVRDSVGRLHYMIGAALSQSRTHGFWDHAPLPAQAAMGLVRDDRYLVARYPMPAGRSAELFTKPLPGPLGDFLSSHPGIRSGEVHGTSPVTGVDATLTFRRLPHYPLTFYVYDPVSNLWGDWFWSALPTYLLMMILYGGGLLIARWARLTREAHTLAREAHVAELEERTRLLEASVEALETTNHELESFTHAISHDLRAPIRAIEGFSAMAQADLAQTSDGRAYLLLERIRDRARRMAGLIADLLELSRSSTRPLEKTRVAMRAVVDSVLEDLHGEAARTRLELGSLPDCEGDAPLLRQVWTNLLSNAFKFSAKSTDPCVRVGYENGAYFVADNGAGFDMAQAGRLFELFSRLHAESEFAGTGVGLTIVKRIITRHGGRIWAEAAPGAGARFNFTLPG